jgi:fluoride ion exporter CrcB/FEX
MMVQGNEVVLLVLGIGVLLFIVGNRNKLKYLPASKILLTAFLFSFTGWSATVIETFLLGNLTNAIEHICYMVSAIFLAIWCWKAFHRPAYSQNVALGKTERRKS